jgi:hypothetical protein
METRKSDPAYNTVARNDFAAMIDVDRYATRSSHFEEIIARTNEHFWNPEDPDYINSMVESTDIFRTLIKTLIKAGIITERTRPFYAAWVDMEELAREGDRMVGDDIAEEGIIYLKEINAGKRHVVRKVA